MYLIAQIAVCSENEIHFLIFFSQSVCDKQCADDLFIKADIFSNIFSQSICSEQCADDLLVNADINTMKNRRFKSNYLSKQQGQQKPESSSFRSMLTVPFLVILEYVWKSKRTAGIIPAVL